MSKLKQHDYFKWVCLVVAIVFGVVLLWMIADFKRKMVVALDKAESTVTQVRSSVEKVNSTMPVVLSEIKQTSRTLSRVADDVELMKRVAGLDNESQSRGVRGLAIYADELQRVLAEGTENQNAHVLIEEVIGSDLKRVETVAEFLVGLNKEMIVAILPLAKSRQEILYRVCHSSVRQKPYYIQFDDSEPVLLEEYLREHHPASTDLPAYKSHE